MLPVGDDLLVLLGLIVRGSPPLEGLLGIDLKSFVCDMVIMLLSEPIEQSGALLRTLSSFFALTRS